jgi:E2F/DP family winged-helix DNA-binding domain
LLFFFSFFFFSNFGGKKWKKKSFRFDRMQNRLHFRFDSPRRKGRTLCDDDDEDNDNNDKDNLILSKPRAGANASIFGGSTALARDRLAHHAALTCNDDNENKENDIELDELAEIACLELISLPPASSAVALAEKTSNKVKQERATKAKKAKKKKRRRSRKRNGVATEEEQQQQHKLTVRKRQRTRTAAAVNHSSSPPTTPTTSAALAMAKLAKDCVVLSSSSSPSSSSSSSTASSTAAPTRKRKIMKPMKRKSSLGTLCEQFVEMCSSRRVGDSVTLDEMSVKLMVDRRRLYDVVNVFLVLNVLQKASRSGQFRWNSMQAVPGALEEIRGSLSPGAVSERAGTPTQLGRRATSLSALTKRFLRLFLCRPIAELRETVDIPVELVATVVEPGASRRRLYDIANILASLSIVTRTLGFSGSEFRFVAPLHHAFPTPNMIASLEARARERRQQHLIDIVEHEITDYFDDDNDDIDDVES